MLLMAVARSSSVSVAIRCVLPVLWTTRRLIQLTHQGQHRTGLEYDLYGCLDIFQIVRAL